MQQPNTKIRQPGFWNALPFWSALLVVPAAIVGPAWGGIWVFLMPFVVWNASVLIDAVIGTDRKALDPGLPDAAIFWHRAITLIWPVLQTAIVFGTIYYVNRADHLSAFEIIMITIGVGVASGAVGIVFAHELMHQQSPTERNLADLLMTQVLYGHYRSEHLLVHHRYVGTPKDHATARMGESFHSFFKRILPGSARSAWAAEKARLARVDRSVLHASNPFWRYTVLQLGWIASAILLGGWLGVLIFAGQSLVAVWQLELINYIEHYGLTRKHIGNGRYEPTKPHHSWDDSHSFTRGFLINVTRHADHHAKPARRFPLLQPYSDDEAPIMPYGYSAMTAMALVPPLWRKVMNPRVRKWRAMHYPEITDWRPYDTHSTPMPR